VEQDVKPVPQHQLVQTVKFYMNSTLQKTHVLLAQMENILQVLVGIVVPHVSTIVKHVRIPVPVQHAKPTMHLVQDTVSPVVQVVIQMGQLLALHAD